MNILAIDSACSVLSVAVSKNEDVYYIETDAGTSHSEHVMGFVDDMMNKACLKPDELDCVLCMEGPGSFTGLRIGFSVAKGLALSLSIPFIPVPTLDCIAYPYRENILVLPVIESKKNSWFYALYRGDKCILPAADEPSDLIAKTLEKYIKTENVILTGPGAAALVVALATALYETLPKELSDNLTLKSEKHGFAKELIAIAKSKKLLDNVNTDCIYSVPEYIRNANVGASFKNE